MKFSTSVIVLPSLAFILGAFSPLVVLDAHAETIVIESETQIHTKTNGFEGGSIDISLLDDLNHGISYQPVTLELENVDTKQANHLQQTTDDIGQARFQLDLDDGSYAGTLTFQGKDYYQKTQTEVQIDIRKCSQHTQLSLPSKDFRPLTAPLEFDLTRTECIKQSANFLAEIGPKSFNIQLEPAKASAHVSIPVDSFSPDTYPLHIHLVNDRYLTPETLQSDVIFYENLFEDDIQFTSHWPKQTITARLSQPVENIPVQLSFSDVDGTSTKLTAASDKDGSLTFELPSLKSECLAVELDRADALSGYTPHSVQICTLRHGLSFKWPAAGIAFLISGTSFLFFLRSRKRKKLPQSPRKPLAHIESTPVIPPPGKTNGITEIICRDAKTKSLLSPDVLTIETNRVPVQIDRWPLRIESRTLIEISHPDYISWSGKLAPNRQYTIELTPRRQYAIDCFEAVCEHQIGESIPWGRETPREFLRKALKSDLPDNQRVLLDAFCQCICAAAFDDRGITDETLEKIHQMTQKLT